MDIFRRGDDGPVVTEIRSKLTGLGLLTTDASPGHFDADCDHAVRDFQQHRGLHIDGMVGPETYRALDEAHWRLGDRVLSHVISRPFVGDDVASLQQRLLEMGFDPGRCDGIYGGATAGALREFQRNVGLAADGTLGPQTLRALQQLRRTVTGGSPAERREEERLLGSERALAGRVIVLDPGHGGADSGATTGDLAEADIVLDLATRIEGRLGAAGVTTYLTRSADTQPDDPTRAGLANDVDADLFLSLHLHELATTRATGSACYFYGTGLAGHRVRSWVGERLAALIQDEVVGRTDLVDGRCHPKSWELLRLTRMPAVRLQPGYLTNPSDAARVAAPEFRDAIAEAVTSALHQLYSPEQVDITAGSHLVPQLSA
jgi:N-acetylmuramoyl-L-alanine amidase